MLKKISMKYYIKYDNFKLLQLKYEEYDEYRYHFKPWADCYSKKY